MRNNSGNEEEVLAKRSCISNQEQQFQREISPDMEVFENRNFNVFIQGIHTYTKPCTIQLPGGEEDRIVYGSAS